MNALWLVLSGVVGGVLGGMGFGGGTLLIPILTFLLDVPYYLAVWVNLVVFLPTAIIALYMHAKSGLVDWRTVGYLLFPAFLGVAVGSFLAGRLAERVLRRVFGSFLIAIGSISIISVFVGYFKKNRSI